MTAGDAHSGPIPTRERTASREHASRAPRGSHLDRYFRFLRTLSPVACLVALAIAELLADANPPASMMAWLVTAYVAGIGYHVVLVGTRLAHDQLLRTSLVIDTILVAGVTGALDAPETANTAYLWPILVASCFSTWRTVAALAGLAAVCSALVPAQSGTVSSSLVTWSGPVVLVLLGAILAFITNRSRTSERELQGERDLEDLVLRFTQRASSGATLDDSLRVLELDLRDTLGMSHAWIDVAGIDRPRRALPGTATVAVTWSDERVARIALAHAGGQPVGQDVIRKVERVATFVGAVIGQTDALRRHEAANARLLEAEQLKDKFLAMASHELRTPLTSIRGFADTMMRQWDILADEDKVRFLTIVVAQSERLARIVEDVMLLSGIQSGRFDLRPAAVRVEHAVERAARDLASADVEIAFAPDVRAYVDPDHLERILDNLLANAAQHGAAPIRISWDTWDGDVVITVSDSGPGVSDELLPRLFGEFQRDRGAAVSPGPGLGLSIVRTLARAHGGEAWYEPNVPSGARFLVRLPAMPL